MFADLVFKDLLGNDLTGNVMDVFCDDDKII